VPEKEKDTDKHHYPTGFRNEDTVAYLLKARTVEPEKQQFLGNARTQQ
jgi:hypothetical protein